MKINLLAGILGAALVAAPLGSAQQQDAKPKTTHPVRTEDDGVRRAIEFQRAKDRDDARQARREAVHPSVDYSNADRRMDDSANPNRMKDPGPGKDK